MTEKDRFDGFFPKSQGETLTHAEWETGWNSAEKISTRVLERLVSAISKLFAELPPQAKQWLLDRSQCDRSEALFQLPDYLDLDEVTPEMALRACRVIVKAVSPARPEWIEFTDRQCLAWSAMEHIRAAVSAAPTEDPLAALKVLEHAIWFGHILAELHVEPYETDVRARVSSQAGLKNQPGIRAIKQADKERLWYQRAVKEWEVKPNASNSFVADVIIKDPSMPHGARSTIRQALGRHKKKS